MADPLIEHALKVARAIHIAAEALTAKDVDETITALVKQIEDQAAALKTLKLEMAAAAYRAALKIEAAAREIRDQFHA